MIRINLLPEEYRKKSRTPIKILLGVTAAAVINAGLATWWGWEAFGVHAEIEGERTVRQLEMDGLTPQVNYYHSLESESKQYKSRETALASITKSRISWTRKLDELVDVVNRGGEGQRHLVWLDDLQVAQTSDPKAKTAGSVRANGHSGSDKFAQVANFLEDLETSSFIKDFQPPAPPEGTQTLVDETLIPPVAWSFPLSLTLKSPEERAGTPEGPKAKPEAQQPNGAKQPTGAKQPDPGAANDGAQKKSEASQ
jgi:Tfp pilus assembly protein PilN